MNNRHHRNHLAFMIILLLAIASISNAFAANDPTYFDIIEDDYLSEWTNILGLRSIIREAQITESLLASLASENAPDIFEISDADYFLTAKQKGYMCEFKPSSKMLAEYEEMPQIVKDILDPLIVADDGQFYGYPQNIYAEAMMFWVPDAWSASPFKNVSPPQSYSELLDFLELYLNTPHDGFCFYYDVGGDNHPERDWIDLLIHCWTIQKRSAGEEVCLDDPEFVSLAERTRELAAKLAKVEPNKKKQKGRQLFTRNYWGNTENGKDTFSWGNMIPWRITADQEPLVNFSLRITCIHADSPLSNHASELLDVIVDHRKDPVNGNQNYFRYLYINPDWIDVPDENRIEIKTNGKKYGFLCMTQEYVNSIWEIHQCAIPCSVYKEYLLYFPYEYYEKQYKLERSFINGDISAEEFATQLDRLRRE